MTGLQAERSRLTLYCLRAVQTGCRAHIAYCWAVTGVKRRAWDVDHSLPAGVEIKNNWSYSPSYSEERQPCPFNRSLLQKLFHVYCEIHDFTPFGIKLTEIGNKWHLWCSTYYRRVCVCVCVCQFHAVDFSRERVYSLQASPLACLLSFTLCQSAWWMLVRCHWDEMWQLMTSN